MAPRQAAKPHKIALADVRNHCASKHCIAPGHEPKSVSHLAEALVGIHAARLQSPLVAIEGRSAQSRQHDAHESLFVERSVVKLRCMRGTLHIAPLHLAPLFHMATLKHRIAVCRLRGMQASLSARDQMKMQAEIVALLGDGVKTSAEIESALLGKGRQTKQRESNRRLKVRVALKTLWEEGLVCYVNATSMFGAERRQYALTSSYYPTLDLTSVSQHEAQLALILLHVRQYGPVTERDIAWWSGLGQGTVHRCLAELAPQLVQVLVGDNDEVMYMEGADFAKLKSASSSSVSWIRLLAYEDSAHKGYLSSRWRYVDVPYYDLLFNQIGEARPSIVRNGQVVGVWEWLPSKRNVRFSIFGEVSASERSEIRDALSRMEATLRICSTESASNGTPSDQLQLSM